jgi:hypothetical protein
MNIHETQHYRTLSNCFYNIWVAALGVSLTEQPRSVKLRVVYLLFVRLSCSVSSFSNVFHQRVCGPWYGETNFVDR